MPVVGAGDRKKYPALRTARDGGHDGKEEQGSRGTMHAVARHAQIRRVGCLRPCFVLRATQARVVESRYPSTVASVC